MMDGGETMVVVPVTPLKAKREKMVARWKWAKDLSLTQKAADLLSLCEESMNDRRVINIADTKTYAEIYSFLLECLHEIKLATGIEPKKQIPVSNNNKSVSDKDIRETADLVTANIINTTKEVLTSDEAARYMGISKSYLYKLTMNATIPCYKPMGKMVYFNRKELEAWLQSNRCATDAELSQKAQAYCLKKNVKR